MDTICQLDMDQPALYYTRYTTPDEALTNELTRLKSDLVLFMIESKIGKVSMQKTLSSIYTAAEMEEATPVTDAITLSTHNFLRLIRRISGKDLKEFAEQWIHAPGSPQLGCSFLINRKRAILEITVKQSCAHPFRSGESTSRFIGPLKIRVFEAQGAFDHSVHVESEVQTFELPYHAKYIRPRKKRDEDGEEIIEEDTPESNLEVPR